MPIFYTDTGSFDRLEVTGSTVLSGSLIISGTTNLSGGGITGSLLGTSSFATTASFALNVPANLVSSSAQINTGSFSGSFTGSLLGTSSFASTSSFVLPSGLPAGTVSSSGQILGNQIQNNTITIGNTSTALGGTSTSITGLTSITSTSITGSITGSLIGPHTGSTFGTASFATTASFALNVPANLVSSSAQINTGSFSGSFTGSLLGTATSASYVLPSGLPAGTVSSSGQILGNQIQNNTITIGNTSTALGGTSTTITGLTSITSTSITGSVTGSITGSLLGTSSFATTASFALNVPQTIVSSAAQINTGSFSGSFIGIANLTSLTASNVQLNSITDTTATNKILVLNTSTNQVFTTSSINALSASFATTASFAANSAVTSFVNGTDNRVITATGPSGITGETTFTFDGNLALITGSLLISSSTTTPAIQTTGSINILSGSITTNSGSVRINSGSFSIYDSVGNNLLIRGSTISTDTGTAVPVVIRYAPGDNGTVFDAGIQVKPENDNLGSLGIPTQRWARASIVAVTSSIISASTSLTASNVQLNGLTDTTATNKVLVLNTSTGQVFTTASVGSGGPGGNAFPYDGRTTPAVISGSLIVSSSQSTPGIQVTGSINIVSGSISATSGSTRVYNSAETFDFGGLYVETTLGGLTNAFIEAGVGTVYIGSNTSNVFLGAGGINSGLVTTTGILPGTDLGFNLGSAVNRWNTIWGASISASTGITTPIISASSAITASNVAIDSNLIVNGGTLSVNPSTNSVNITGSLNISGSTTTPAIRVTGSVQFLTGSSRIYTSLDSPTNGRITLEGGTSDVYMRAGGSGASIGSNTDNLDIFSSGARRIFVNSNGLIPSADSLRDLGADGFYWRDLFVDRILTSTISGSFSVTGSINATGAVTASAISASAFVSFPEGLRVTGSVTASTGFFGTSSWAVTASNALTASFALNAGGGSGFPYDGRTTPAIISGSLILSSSLATPGLVLTGSINMVSGNAIFRRVSTVTIIDGNTIRTDGSAAGIRIRYGELDAGVQFNPNNEIIPETSGLGSLGTSTQRWANAFINNINLSGSSTTITGSMTMATFNGGFTNVGEMSFAVSGAITASGTATVNIDLNRANYYTVSGSGTGTVTWTVTNVPPAGRVQTFVIEYTNGGIKTNSWFTNTRWPGGVAPTLTSASANPDLLSFTTDDAGANWRGVLLQRGSA